MEWTRPGIRRHFDFQGKDEAGRKRYIITLQITNNDPEHNVAIIHIPFEQDGWSMEVPEDLRRKLIIEGLKIEEGAEPWICRTTYVEALEGEQKGLVLHQSTEPMERSWGAYLEPRQTATITFEALVTCDQPLIEQTITLRYYPDLGWRPTRPTLGQEPVLKPSPFYSSNLDLEEGHSA